MEGVVLSPDQYKHLRLMFDRICRAVRGRREVAFQAALEPLFREYQAITGEAERSWIHIIVHQLDWQSSPPEARR